MNLMSIYLMFMFILVATVKQTIFTVRSNKCPVLKLKLTPEFSKKNRFQSEWDWNEERERESVCVWKRMRDEREREREEERDKKGSWFHPKLHLSVFLPTYFYIGSPTTPYNIPLISIDFRISIFLLFILKNYQIIYTCRNTM